MLMIMKDLITIIMAIIIGALMLAGIVFLNVTQASF